MNILIVDDDPIQRRILRGQLARLGYNVCEAADGELAWNLLCQEPIPIVITDWMMPTLDGPGLIARIRAAQFPSYTYTVLLTAKDDRSDVIAGLEAGADDYLTKPCDPNELRARVAIAVRIVDLETQLRAARDTDALTGLRNRRAITTTANAELARVQREGRLLSLVMLDIDHFKKVNDQYGHHSGDLALCQIAKVITGNVRPYDLVGRWGGEELLVLLPEATLAGAAAVAERVRANIAALPLTLLDGRQVNLTASMGVSSTEFGGAPMFERLLQDADTALYRAKADGRNCVRTAPSLVETDLVVK